MSETVIISDSTPIITEVVVQDTLVTETDVSTTVMVEVTETVIITGQNETLIVEASPGQNATIITVGEQGPAGVSGEGGSAVYAHRVDLSHRPVLYRAEAQPGSDPADNVWRIRKLVYLLSGDDISLDTQWAEGTEEFIHVWDERLTYTYS